MSYHTSTRSYTRVTWRLFVPITAAGLVACAATAPHQQQLTAAASVEQQTVAQQQATAAVVKTLKRKVAIGRFSNETLYGRTLEVDPNLDPLGKQASDMLSTRLVQTQKFLVFERPDLNKIQGEQTRLKDANLVGVDALILRFRHGIRSQHYRQGWLS